MARKKMKGNILVVDDNQSVLTSLELLLQNEFKQVNTLKNPANLISSIREQQTDVILLDMNFKAGINTGNEGIHLLRTIAETDPDISVVLITAFGDVELAVRAVKEGAFDFILKPWENDKLIATLHAALKLRLSKLENKGLKDLNQELARELSSKLPILKGESPVMQGVYSMAEKVAATDADVLILGENGTGKEVIAREIHRLSPRKKEIMVHVDMGAISESLFESELFGHVKGAFTDAREDRTGKFETAGKGTLFLDEIANLSPALQSKILAVLQNRTVIRLGSNVPIPIDVRLISATNADLKALIAEGRFREDLFYRLNTITIELPPLRERGPDIELFAKHFLQVYREKYHKEELKISSGALKAITEYHWPGNVRELQHCMERAVIMADDKLIETQHLALNKAGTHAPAAAFQTLEEMEKQMIVSTLEKEGGKIKPVAEKLGITRQTLYNKIRKYGIDLKE
jgi:DNA-binding NtrC family response regulator